MSKSIVTIQEKENKNGNYLEFEIDGENCLLYASPDKKGFVFENRAMNIKETFTDAQVIKILKESLTVKVN